MLTKDGSDGVLGDVVVETLITLRERKIQWLWTP